MDEGQQHPLVEDSCRVTRPVARAEGVLEEAQNQGRAH